MLFLMHCFCRCMERMKQQRPSAGGALNAASAVPAAGVPLLMAPSPRGVCPPSSSCIPTLGVHPSGALERANRKFTARFQDLEALARERGMVLHEAGLEALDRLWDEVKVRERGGAPPLPGGSAPPPEGGTPP